MTIYRNAWGQFSTERGASRKQVDGKHFVRLFGGWVELKPVTPASIHASLARYDKALRAATDDRIQPRHL